jgi:hypothetical protein
MLAIDNNIFASPEKDARWAQIDDKSFSFNESGIHWLIVL